jgi:hypothetical protein
LTVQPPAAPLGFSTQPQSSPRFFAQRPASQLLSQQQELPALVSPSPTNAPMSPASSSLPTVASSTLTSKGKVGFNSHLNFSIQNTLRGFLVIIFRSKQLGHNFLVGL